MSLFLVIKQDGDVQDPKADSCPVAFAPCFEYGSILLTHLLLRDSLLLFYFWLTFSSSFYGTSYQNLHLVIALAQDNPLWSPGLS